MSRLRNSGEIEKLGYEISSDLAMATARLLTKVGYGVTEFLTHSGPLWSNRTFARRARHILPRVQYQHTKNDSEQSSIVLNEPETGNDVETRESGEESNSNELREKKDFGEKEE